MENNVDFKQLQHIYIDNNYYLIEPYLNFRSKFFGELSKKIREACKCTLLNANIALITLTNHILERLLKLALIKYDILQKDISGNEWNTAYTEADKAYSGLMLNDTINRCQTRGIITKDHKKFLQDKIRIQLRNGFSHAETDKILKDQEGKNITVYEKCSKTATGLSPIILNTKTYPELQSVSTHTFANDVALYYFDFVYQLIHHIELNLLALKKN